MSEELGSREVFDEAFVAGARYREDAAEDRVRRARRISAAHAQAMPWRAVAPDGPRPSARRRGRLVLLALLLVGAVLGGLRLGLLVPVGGAPGAVLGDPLLAAGVPPPQALRGWRRVLPPVEVPAADASADGSRYGFLAMLDRTSPVAWSPCLPVHYVTRPAGQPAGAGRLVAEAVAQLGAATGLRFVDDGATTEAPSDTRPAYQPERYGRRWAPVLLAWSDPSASPQLAGGVGGYAGPVPWGQSPRTTHYVSGQVVLDAPQLTRLLASRDGAARVREVVLHELGHLAGLAHVEDPTQLMNPTSSAVLGGFGAGDRRGLALLGRGGCS